MFAGFITVYVVRQYVWSNLNEKCLVVHLGGLFSIGLMLSGMSNPAKGDWLFKIFLGTGMPV